MYFPAPKGWFHSPLYNQYQQVNNQVYVYVIRNFSGWQVQLYKRGTTSMCELEARTNDRTENGFLKMISLGEKWLTRYGDEEMNEITKDEFYVFNPDGVWGPKRLEKKEYYI